MKIVVLCAALTVLAVCHAFSEEDYEQVRHGPRPENIDDAVSTIQCRKGLSITKCECDRPEACDGAWIRLDKFGAAYCDAYNRADNKEKKIPAVLAKVTCARLMLRVDTGYVKYDGGKLRPTAACPKNYRLLSCTFSSSFIQHENPPPRGKKGAGATCTIRKACKKCRVQATCLRATKFV